MRMPQSLKTPKAKLVAVLLATTLGLSAGVLVVAMNGKEVPRPNTQATSTQAPTTPAPVATVRVLAHSPLTGLTGTPINRVIAVKVNNTGPENAGGAPRSDLLQRGIGSADIVVEQLVEGGLTRLIAMYQSVMPTKVGPVRSLRATDSYVVLPVRGLLLSSGGSGLEVRTLKARGVDFRTGGAGYGRLSSSVFGEVVDTKTLRQPYLKVPDLLTFGRPNLSKAKSVSTFTIRFSSMTVSFTYRNGIYKREPDLAQVRFPATNVLVLRTPVRSLFVDQHGAKVPEEVLLGSGEAILYTHGKVITGQWHKPSQASSIKTTFAVPEGKTAIELVPANQL